MQALQNADIAEGYPANRVLFLQCRVELDDCQSHVAI